MLETAIPVLVGATRCLHDTSRLMNSLMTMRTALPA